MPTVSWELNVNIGGALQITESDALLAESYDKNEVSIKKGSKNTRIEVQPADDSKQIKFILIAASKYQGDKLFYTLKGAGAGAVEKISLDAPQFFIGAGMIQLIDSPFQEIFVTNNLGEDVQVRILVGRDATP